MSDTYADDTTGTKQDPEFKVEIPTDAQVTAVAKAMDVDGRLDWESGDHDKVVECANARDEARHLIIGSRAVVALYRGDLVVEEPAPEPIEEPAQPDGGSIDTGVTDGLPPAPVDQPQPQAG